MMYILIFHLIYYYYVLGITSSKTKKLLCLDKVK